MDNSRFSVTSVSAALHPPGGGASGRRLSASAFLSGRTGRLILVAVSGTIGLSAAWLWLGNAAMIPLLYVLPCAAMMAMCMKGHGKSSNPDINPSGGSEASR